MAGHNKWSQIKHKKAKTDAQKGKAFSKVSREIMLATKLGGPNVDMNPRLRLALQKAKEVNMPNDNVKRAIQKGSGEGDINNLEEIAYEAYGPYGVALIIETITDNKNRTLPNIKTILNKGEGKLAAKGAVSYLFHKKGLVLFENVENEDKIIDLAMSANAEDICSKPDHSVEVIVEPDNYNNFITLLENENISYLSASLTLVPSTTVNLDEVSKAEKLLKLMDSLEEDDDVQNVYANFELDDHVSEKLIS